MIHNRKSKEDIIKVLLKANRATLVSDEEFVDLIINMFDEDSRAPYISTTDASNSFTPHPRLAFRDGTSIEDPTKSYYMTSSQMDFNDYTV